MTEQRRKLQNRLRNWRWHTRQGTSVGNVYLETDVLRRGTQKNEHGQTVFIEEYTSIEINPLGRNCKVLIQGHRRTHTLRHGEHEELFTGWQYTTGAFVDVRVMKIIAEIAEECMKEWHEAMEAKERK